MSIDWENEGAGKTLVLPNPPWYDPTRPPAPRWRPTSSTPERESTRPIAELTQQLSAEMLATMPIELADAARAAYAASIDAGRRLNKAQRELSELAGPAPAGLTVEQRSERHMRRIGLVSYIEELRQENERLGEQATTALDAARSHVQYYSGRQIHTDARARAHAMRDEASRLEEEAGRLEIATMNALGKVQAWLPTEAPPAVEPTLPQPAPQAPKRRGLFK